MPKSSDKSVFDVSKPGKSAPSATSRPIITGHGPMLKDPMVNDKQADEKPSEESPKTKTTAKVIVPVDTPEDEDKIEVSRSKPADKKPADENTEVETKPPEDSEVKSEETDKPAEAVATTGSVDTAPQAEGLGSAAVDQALNKQPTGPTKEEIARQEQIEGLVEAETYFLPIGQVTRRRNNRRAVVVLLVVLLLALVGGYAALDAGLVDAGFELPFDLIKN